MPATLPALPWPHRQPRYKEAAPTTDSSWHSPRNPHPDRPCRFACTVPPGCRPVTDTGTPPPPRLCLRRYRSRFHKTFPAMPAEAVPIPEDKPAAPRFPESPSAAFRSAAWPPPQKSKLPGKISGVLPAPSDSPAADPASKSPGKSPPDLPAPDSPHKESQTAAPTPWSPPEKSFLFSPEDCESYPAFWRNVDKKVPSRPPAERLPPRL